jgi:amidase
MKLSEYATYDGLGLARLVQRKDVTAKELAGLAQAAIAAINPKLGAVVETYEDRIAGVTARQLGDGPFKGVPFLIKDVFGHEAGRKIEFGSRLCQGMLGTTDSHLAILLRKAGVNIIGRSAAPEFSMAGTTESALYGNCSTPWKEGYSAGGSSGGAQAAVTAGIVPLAHGSDIGGSIRIPASYCGGVGFKPSRMRVSVAPTVDEGGWGYSMNFVQARTMRDVAAMLDCLSVPAVGDPFVIPKPALSYARLLNQAPKSLRIGLVLTPVLGVAVDPEVAKAVKATGTFLVGLGHKVDLARLDVGGENLLDIARDLFFFDFANRLDGYAARVGRKPGPDTLEPAIWSIYQRSAEITPSRFTAAWARANIARRAMSAFYSKFDLMLSPTTAETASPWGSFNLSREGADFDGIRDVVFARPTQFTIPHNFMGTPAISLPLAMHSNGLPIGVQLAGRPSEDHVVLQMARVLEQALPWAKRKPVIHVSHLN